MADFKEFDHFISLATKFPFFCTDPRRAKPRINKPFPRLVAWHQHQVFTNGQGRKFMRDLECTQHALGEQVMWRQAGNVRAIKKYPSGCRRVKPGDDIEQGCLASAVRAD